MHERKLTEGCPVEIKYGPYHVRYCVKKDFSESWMSQEMNSQVECFQTEESRKQWIDWHKENTKWFEVLKTWYVEPPREKTEQEKEAEQARIKRYNAELAARQRKRKRQMYFATRNLNKK